ncbi:MAG: hypothetical protein EBT20_20175, partial [Alphaproteobacteria bacterium]|nr:hypothetical protein [Alphaproteobacteria bacterium]
MKTSPEESNFFSHLEGKKPIGIYPLDDNNAVRFAAIDIDEYPIDHAGLSMRLDKWELPMVVCNSKSGGAHIYIFFEEPEEPALVISELRKVSTALGYPKAEIFPKQEIRSNGGYGSFINLPFFGHPKLSYNCWGGDEQLDLDGFLALAESRITNLGALSASIADAGLNPSSVSVSPTNNHAIAGRNDYLFEFGRSVQDAVQDQAALLAILLQKNNVATEADHPNFGTKGPLPSDEVEQICKNVIVWKEKEQKSGVKHVVNELNKCHAHVMVGGKARILHIKT